MQNFQSVGLSNFAYNAMVSLTHNSYIYVTAIAKNSAGLQGVSYSDKILVDLTPPNIEEVLDGDFLGDLLTIYLTLLALRFVCCVVMHIIYRCLFIF